MHKFFFSWIVWKSILDISIRYTILFTFLSPLKTFSQNLDSCEIHYNENIFNYITEEQDNLMKLKPGALVKIHPNYYQPSNLSTYDKIKRGFNEIYPKEGLENVKIYTTSFKNEAPKKLQQKAKSQSPVFTSNDNGFIVNDNRTTFLYKNKNLYTLSEINNDNADWFVVIDSSYSPREPAIVDFRANDFRINDFITNSNFEVRTLKDYGSEPVILGGYIINVKLRSINIPSHNREFEILSISNDIMLRDVKTDSLLVYRPHKFGNYLIEKKESDRIIERDRMISELTAKFKNKKITIPSLEGGNDYDYVIIDAIKLTKPSYSYDFNLRVIFRGFTNSEPKEDSFILDKGVKFYLFDCYRDSMIAFNKRKNNSEQLNLMKEALLNKLNAEKFKRSLIKEGFSEKEINAILNNKLYVGMSERGVEYGFGTPIKSYQYVWKGENVTVMDYGYDLQVYIKNRKVIGWYMAK